MAEEDIGWKKSIARCLAPGSWLASPSDCPQRVVIASESLLCLIVPFPSPVNFEFWCWIIFFLNGSFVLIVYRCWIDNRGTNEGQLEGPDSAKFLFPEGRTDEAINKSNHPALN